MSVREGIWTNGKRQVTGTWRYHWPSDRFVIQLRSGSRKVVSGDHPEWGNWKLVRDMNEPTPQRPSPPPPTAKQCSACGKLKDDSGNTYGWHLCHCGSFRQPDSG